MPTVNINTSISTNNGGPRAGRSSTSGRAKSSGRRLLVKKGDSLQKIDPYNFTNSTGGYHSGDLGADTASPICFEMTVQSVAFADRVTWGFTQNKPGTPRQAIIIYSIGTTIRAYCRRNRDTGGGYNYEGVIGTQAIGDVLRLCSDENGCVTLEKNGVLIYTFVCYKLDNCPVFPSFNVIGANASVGAPCVFISGDPVDA